MQLGGSTINNGLLTFPVYGTPTTASTLQCTSPARVNNLITCTITVSGATGATTGLASDYSISATTSITSPSTSNGGLSYTFQATPTVLTTLYQITVLIGPSTIVGGYLSFAVYGTPTTASTLACSVNSPQRAGSSISCTLSVSNAAGSTTAVSSDFVASSPSTALTTINGGSTFTFTNTPTSITSSYNILVTYKGNAVSGGSITFTVFGTPTTASRLSCTPTLPARALVPIHCSIAVSDNTGSATTGLATDFTVASSTGSGISLSSADGGMTFTFTTTPQSELVGYSIACTIGGFSLAGGPLSYTIYGSPTTASSLSCSKPAVLRVGGVVSCTLTVIGISGPTTALASDFAVSAVDTGSITISSSNGGASFTFTASPATNNTAFSILAETGGLTVRNGNPSYVVYGIPTTASSLSCMASTPLRSGSPIACVLSVSDANGATTALATDFTASTRTLKTVPISTTNGGSSFAFSVAPLNNFTQFNINVSIGAVPVTSGLQSFLVYGIPTTASTLTCTGPTPLRTRNVISCVIHSLWQINVATTGLASDFTAYSSETGVIPLDSSDGGATFAFSVAPENTTTSLIVNASVNSVLMSHGKNVYVVYGHPDNSSVLSCDGSRARVGGSSILCKIEVMQDFESTTGLAADFRVISPTAVTALSATPLSNGAEYSFSVAPPKTFADAFVVNVLVSGVANISTWYRVFGPSSGAISPEHTTLLCLPLNPRISTTITCTVAFSTQFVATSVVQSDISITIGPYQPPAQPTRRRSDSTVYNLNSTNGGGVYTFDVVLPDVPTLAYEINVAVAGSLISNTTVEVFGNPSKFSTLTCTGASSKPGFVHSLEQVDCIITCIDGAGAATTGLATDFDIVVNGSPEHAPLSTSNGGATFHFSLTSPNSTAAQFDVELRLSANNGKITQPPVVLKLICTLHPTLHAGRIQIDD